MAKKSINETKGLLIDISLLKDSDSQWLEALKHRHLIRELEQFTDASEIKAGDIVYVRLVTGEEYCDPIYEGVAKMKGPWEAEIYLHHCYEWRCYSGKISKKAEFYKMDILLQEAAQKVLSNVQNLYNVGKPTANVITDTCQQLMELTIKCEKQHQADLDSIRKDYESRLKSDQEIIQTQKNEINKLKEAEQDPFRRTVTYDNVTDYIARRDSRMRREELINMFEALLPKDMHEKFRDDINDKVEAMEAKRRAKRRSQQPAVRQNPSQVIVKVQGAQSVQAFDIHDNNNVDPFNLL